MRRQLIMPLMIPCSLAVLAALSVPSQATTHHHHRRQHHHVAHRPRFVRSAGYAGRRIRDRHHHVTSVGCIPQIARQDPDFNDLSVATIRAAYGGDRCRRDRRHLARGASHRATHHRTYRHLVHSHEIHRRLPSWSTSPLVAEARRWIGSNPTRRRSLWCARFMNFVLKRTGYKGTGSDMALSFIHYGHRVSGPRIGAIAVMVHGHRHGHVGVVAGIDAHGNPIIISGNYLDRVAEAIYPRGRIYAYVMPGK